MSNFHDKAQLINNLSYKFAKTFTYNSNQITGTFNFGENLNLNKEYVYTLKLNGFYAWENLINITEDINKLNYSTGSDAPWRTITFPVGIWNFNDLNNKIKSVLKQNGDTEDNINIAVAKNEYKINLTLSGGYRVDFNIPNSIHKVFGFEKVTYTTNGNHLSPNIPDIASTQVFFIVIDLIEPNILRKKNGDTLHLQYVRAIKPFQKNVGEAVIIEDSNPIKYKLLESVYNNSSCKISLLDEDGNPIKTKGDEFTIVFTIESA